MTPTLSSCAGINCPCSSSTTRPTQICARCIPLKYFRMKFYLIKSCIQRSHIVETESFSDTFGPKAQRKRARIDAGTFEELSKLGAAAADEAESARVERELQAAAAGEAAAIAEEATHADYMEPIYMKGTSRRIYGELYKVIDSSDVVLHVIDARDPLGTICESVLDYIRKEKAHKQVVLVINKCDLVPNWVTVCVLPLYLISQSNYTLNRLVTSNT